MSKLVSIYYGQGTIDNGASFELLGKVKFYIVDLFVKSYFHETFDKCPSYTFELIHACNAPELQLYMITRDGEHFSSIFVPLIGLVND